MLRRIGFSFAVMAVICTTAAASTIIYVADPAAPPSNLAKAHAQADIGSSSFFDIFVQTDQLVAGIALNVDVTGPAIQLTGAQVPNYGGPRWAATQNGFVSGGGLNISGMDAFAIPGFGSVGMNPANTAADDGFNGGINAYHFARVSYNIVGVGESQISLQIGDNEIGVDGPIFLGVGDPAVADTGAGSAGLRSQLADGLITVLGMTAEPPVVTDFIHPRMSAYVGTDPADILHTFTQVGGDDPITWGDFALDSYTPNYGGVGTGPAIGATFDPATQQFVWNAVGSPRGDYVWRVTASNEGGQDTGFLTVQLKAVPEPTTLGLAGLAMIGLVGLFRRRS